MSQQKIDAQLVDRPYFSAHLAAEQSPSSGISTKVLLDTVDSDSNSWWDAVNHRYTPQKAGRYRVSWSIQSNPSSAFVQLTATASKTGAIYAQAQNTAPTIGDGVGGTITVNMNGTTDYIELFGVCSATGPNFRGSTASGVIVTWLDIQYVGP